MSNASQVGYRRNGKQQACEPCRKGKLRCDHGAPYCGRCVRLKATYRCTYHPAPMTKVLGIDDIEDTKQKQTHVPQKDRPSLSNSGASRVASVQKRSFATQTSPPASPTQISANDTERSSHKNYAMRSQANWKKAVYPRSSRYYGPSSFQAVFSEESLFLGDDTRKHPGTWIFGQPLLGRSRPNTPEVRTTHAIKALRSIPPKDTCFKLVGSFKSMHDPTIDMTMILHCISSLWSNFGLELSSRSDESLTRISDVLFNNEETPLPPSPDDGLEWLDTFNGPNLRFEMLGILFCGLGLAYHFLQDTDPMLQATENEGRDRRQAAWRMKECADVCLNMCESAETVNFLVTALILNLKVLESGCIGDEAYKIRCLNGSMITSAISSGLHRLPNLSSSTFTAASEYKRRLFSAVYCSDKTHASLNGTPPLLSRRHSDIEPCLDLDPKAPYLSAHDLAAAIRDLDSDGWNTSGAIYDTTLLRAKVRLSSIREEILDLSLGANLPINEDTISELHLRNQEIFSRFPQQLHYYTSDKIPKNTTGSVLYEQAYITLQSLQNMFLIERVANVRKLSNGQGLLDVAMEMMDIALMFWIKRDELMVFSSGFDWIIIYYGIPCAGIICVELLRQSSRQNAVKFSRSEAIQKLTLFIGFLEWIRPTHGNYALAGRLKNVVKGVLDHVLEHRAVPERSSMEGTPFDSMLPTFNDLEDLDWLNTIDWTQGSWMDFN